MRGARHVLHDLASRLWRQLPVALRQSAFRNTMSLLRPRLGEPQTHFLTDRNVPRIVVGLLSSASGLGQSARLAANALRQEGFKVLGVDLSRYFHGSDGLVEIDLEDGRHHSGPAHVIVAINAPYMPYALALLGAGFLRHKHVTGYWAWELPRVPDSWRVGLSAVHDIAVPSRFTERAVRAIAPSGLISVAPYPVALDFPLRNPVVDRVRGPFTVLSASNVASGYVRKNPCAAIRAFRSAFGNSNSAQLKLHVTNVSHFPAARAEIEAEIGGACNIELSCAALNDREFRQWWSEGDIYLSLHRSEGFGLPIAEALCAGLPAVATGWSGNMDFMDPSNSYPVSFSMVDVCDPQHKYPSDLGRWAEPDVSAAARLLAECACSREQTRARAGAAKLDVQRQLSGRAFVARLLHSESRRLPPGPA